ncbi:VOC family protein [Streptomyces sp. NPDC048278]|uniref:VOC family protein n=1 Tax=Streptomyces sp. NPDC048278 TaxID=3155809 RepID=UPI0034340DD3
MPSGIPTARGVDHVGITVPDLGQAVDYFVSVLGAREVYRGPVIEDATGSYLADHLDVHPRARLQVAMTRWGRQQNVELLEYRAPGGRSEMPGNADVGSVHLSIDVEDIQAAWEYLADDPRNRMIGDGPQTIRDGVNDDMTWFYFRTPWGMVIECSSRTAQAPADWPCALHRPTGPWHDEPAEDTAAPYPPSSG